MMNKVILIGNLGFDPEIRTTQTGAAVATIRLATSRRWKDRQTGERKEETEWHRVVFFNRQAEVVRDFLKKGSQIYVEGRLQTRKWQGDNGEDRYSTEIIAEEMQMLKGGKTDNQSDYEPANANQQPANSFSANPADYDFDNSIPF